MVNEKLMEALDNVNSAEELAAVFAEHNVDLGGMSIEDAYKQLKAEESEELGEDSLDDVSGGVLLITPIVGTGIAVAAGAAVAGYKAYKKWKKKKR